MKSPHPPAAALPMALAHLRLSAHWAKPFPGVLFRAGLCFLGCWGRLLVGETTKTTHFWGHLLFFDTDPHVQSSHTGCRVEFTGPTKSEETSAQAVAEHLPAAWKKRSRPNRPKATRDAYLLAGLPLEALGRAWASRKFLPRNTPPARMLFPRNRGKP